MDKWINRGMDKWKNKIDKSLDQWINRLICKQNKIQYEEWEEMVEEEWNKESALMKTSWHSWWD